MENRTKITQEDKELLLKDLCTRLPYDVIIHYHWEIKGTDSTIDDDRKLKFSDVESLKYMLTELQDNRFIIEWKPYLRPMSSMTKEEAKKIATLHEITDILSIKITDEYIDITVDDGVGSTERRIIWYDEIVSSIEIFDWLNKNHFDYRGLIPKGLAIDITKEDNPYK